jgi:hypothetical protein
LIRLPSRNSLSNAPAAWRWAGLPTQQGQQGHAQQEGHDPRPPGGDAQAKFVPVKPVVREGVGGANPARPSGELRIAQGRFFSFALPPGWRVGEDGQFALTLVAPDSKALTVMVGNAGLPSNHPPARFAHDKLSAMQPQNLQMGEPRQARPAAGFPHAIEFDVGYWSRGAAYRSVAKVSVAPAYDTATMALTAALSTADQWGGYASWLPQVADQVSATNGAAFGMRGIMQQNLQDSKGVRRGRPAVPRLVAEELAAGHRRAQREPGPEELRRARKPGRRPDVRESLRDEPARRIADDAHVLLDGSAGAPGRNERSERRSERGLDRRMAQDGAGGAIGPASRLAGQALSGHWG